MASEKAKLAGKKVVESLRNGKGPVFNGTPRGQNHAYELLKMAESLPETWFTQI